MKYIYLLIILPSISLAQAPYINIILEDSELQFQKIYHDSSSSQNELIKLLSIQIPKIEGVVDFRENNGIISCRFETAHVNYRKFGKRWGNTPLVLNDPFDANIVVEVRNNRYKVTITGIVFKSKELGDSELSTILTNRNRKWRTGESYRLVGEIMDMYLADSFGLSRSDDW